MFIIMCFCSINSSCERMPSSMSRCMYRNCSKFFILTSAVLPGEMPIAFLSEACGVVGELVCAELLGGGENAFSKCCSSTNKCFLHRFMFLSLGKGCPQDHRNSRWFIQVVMGSTDDHPSPKAQLGGTICIIMFFF